MFILTRYFEKKKYQSQFMAGSIRFASMSRYTKIIPERGLQEAAEAGYEEAIRLLNSKLSSGQQDVMEGSVADLELDALSFLNVDGVNDIVIGNPKARAVGYSYCNIVCFNKVGYRKIYDLTSFRPPMAEPRIIAYDVEEPTSMSDDFGEYAPSWLRLLSSFEAWRQKDNTS